MNSPLCDHFLCQDQADMTMMNVCPVVVISHRPGGLSLRSNGSPRPVSSSPDTTSPQKHRPPTGGEGTEGRGATAEKTPTRSSAAFEHRRDHVVRYLHDS
ncbi:hypothetical protein EYF80_027057 [Liparis tanakae]|uniref:Uncharacterized protein n=1 Tax=Liparis tanakae TaxID=230148 RepID=A0A4Z2HBR6_9TELE|nr:hypothetical protein EYF80_027057 [Liparis tanakae]